jgi:hypothetical protein
MSSWSTSQAIPLAALEALFMKLAARWRTETAFTTSIQRPVLHPAYQQIIGLGPAALSLILWELEARRDHWLWALWAIDREDPASPEATFDEAVDAWLRWGRERRLLVA